jgi:hypothetical protein
MVKCSPHQTGTPSQQRFRLLTTSGRTVCRKACTGRMRSVLTRRPPQDPNLPKQFGRSHQRRLLCARVGPLRVTGFTEVEPLV